MLTQKEVRSLFNYDPETGELTWRATKGTALVGAKAGCDSGRGYLQVQVNRKLYYAHRLIWLWVHGYFPEHQVDHINRVRDDNRLENLREVTQQCNMRNSKQQSNNTSGVTGVYWVSKDSRWLANIKINSRLLHLGYFTDFTEAVLTRLAAEQCLNWEGCDSSSDAFRYLQEIRHGQRKTE